MQDDRVTSKQRKRNLENYVYDFIENPPGHKTENGQLIVKHPGAKNPWSCYKCQEQLENNKLFVNHCKDKHQIDKFVYCCSCGYGSENSKSTGSHLRYCDGNVPEEHKRRFKCDLCRFSSNDENGLLVHNSVAHKEEYSEGLKEKEKGFKWTDTEFKYLAEVIHQLKKDKVRNVNKAAGDRLGKTEQAIQKIRTKTEYKILERQVKEKLVADERRRQEGGENSREQCKDRDNTEQLEVQESDRQHEEQVIRPLPTVYNEIPLDITTPQTVVRRRLPIVPPTPFDEDSMLSQMIIDQDPTITVSNTPSIQADTRLVQPMPTECRRLPQTPLDRSRITRQIDQAPKVRTETARRLGIGLQFTEGKPDYKKTAYLDAMNYKKTLGDETILDEVIKGYLEGDKTWNEVTKVIASEGFAKRKRKPRERKGPWMKNRRGTGTPVKPGYTSLLRKPTTKIKKQRSTR